MSEFDLVAMLLVLAAGLGFSRADQPDRSGCGVRNPEIRRAPKSVEIVSRLLFIDSVGLMVFLILVGLALPVGGHGGAGLDLVAAELFFVGALGGALLRLADAWVAFNALARPWRTTRWRS